VTGRIPAVFDEQVRETHDIKILVCDFDRYIASFPNKRIFFMSRPSRKGLLQGRLKIMAVYYSARHVLVVEDTLSIRRSICKVLQAEGCECRQAVNGAAALEQLKKEHFDLVLTDYHMPLMDGMEFLKQLTELHDSEDFPLVIMMTSDWDDAVQKQAMKAGASLVVQKTCDLHQLVAQVMKVFAPKPDSGGVCFNKQE
jgi:two-component system, chemotaxis family, chemotaxis protein CheY